MSNLLKWFYRRRDDCSVSYSRFGVPGGVAEDRPQPTSIIVEAFDENDPEFVFLRIMHVKKAAEIAADLGIVFIILLFIYTFLKFDWSLMRSDADALVIVLLLIFLLIGILIHHDVLVGIRKLSPKRLLSFIIAYSLFIGNETLFVLFHLYYKNRTNFMAHREVVLSTLLIFTLLIIIQAVMLSAVSSCRLYLSAKLVHQMALKVAENSRAKNPGLQIIFVDRQTNQRVIYDNANGDNSRQV